MKRFTGISVMAVLSALLCITSYAQGPGRCPEHGPRHGCPDERQRMSREELAEVQAKHIASELALDDETAAKFIDVYRAYQEEIWSMAPHHGRMPAPADSTMTEKDAEQAIKAGFEHNQKMLDIRRKYYKEYSKFLTQKQIKSIYDHEIRVMHHISHRHGPAHRRR